MATLFKNERKWNFVSSKSQKYNSFNAASNNSRERNQSSLGRN